MALEFTGWPAKMRRVKAPSWLPRVLVESALIVFSVLVALAVDQWRGERDTAARAVHAMASLTR